MGTFKGKWLGKYSLHRTSGYSVLTMRLGKLMFFCMLFFMFEPTLDTSLYENSAKRLVQGGPRKTNYKWGEMGPL